MRVCLCFRIHVSFSSPLYSIKRMDSCYWLYLVFIPNIFYIAGSLSLIIFKGMCLTEGKQKQQQKQLKIQKRVLHNNNLCVMRTQKNHAAYTHVVLLRSFLEVDDEKKLMRLMVHNWCLDEDFWCVLLYCRVFVWPLYRHVYYGSVQFV